MPLTANPDAYQTMGNTIIVGRAGALPGTTSGSLGAVTGSTATGTFQQSGSAFETNWDQRISTVGSNLIRAWRPSSYSVVENYVASENGVPNRLQNWTGGAFTFGPSSGGAPGTPAPFYQWTNVNWRLDPSVALSGGYAWHSRIPAGAGRSAGGYVTIPFTDSFTSLAARNANYVSAGQEVYVQWHFRCNAGFLRNWNAANGTDGTDSAFKQVIVGAGDQTVGPPNNYSANPSSPQTANFGTCTNLEVVAQQRPFGHIIDAAGRYVGISAYHACAGRAAGNFHDFVSWIDGSHSSNQSGNLACPYPAGVAQGVTSPPCIGFLPDVWGCYEFHIKVGAYGGVHSGNRIRFWAAPNRDNSPQLVADTALNYPSGYAFATADTLFDNDAPAVEPQRYGVVHLLNYITGLNVAPVTCDSWYSELIISRTPIPFPNNPQSTAFAGVGPIGNVTSGSLGIIVGSTAQKNTTMTGSALATAANLAAATPGTFVELVGTGLTDQILHGDTTSGAFVSWQNKVAWDPFHKQIKCYGSSHAPGNDKFVVYDEATNAWSNPINGTHSGDGSHWMDHNACHPNSGDFIFPSRGSSKIILHIPHGSTTYPPAQRGWPPAHPSFTAQYSSAWEYFPDAQSFVYGNSYLGLHFYHKDTGVKTLHGHLSSFSGTPAMGWTADSYGQTSRYLASRQCVYMLGGRLDPGQRIMVKINADGSWVRLDDLPWWMDFFSQVTVCSVTGRMIAARWNGLHPSGAPEVYDFDESRSVGSRWQPRTDLISAFQGSIYSFRGEGSPEDRANGMHSNRVSCYIPDYNVTFWLAAYGILGGSPVYKTWVYRHKT